MFATVQRHWPRYWLEALGIAAFMTGAGLLTLLLEHSDAPARRAIPSDLGRHALLGLGMTGVTAAILYSPIGTRSGGLMNPATTWAFYRLGKIGLTDAVAYTLAQFAGAAATTFLLRLTLGRAFTEPDVRYGLTLPGPMGGVAAFWAEFFISFGLMLASLLCVNSKRLRPYLGVVIAGLIGVYIAFETPYSGMSMNPARSFGAALTSRHWDSLWIFFVAPPLAMLLAAEAYRLLRRAGWVTEAGAIRPGLLIADYDEGPRYPLDDGPLPDPHVLELSKGHLP